jgi:hypothetical protein
LIVIPAEEEFNRSALLSERYTRNEFTERRKRNTLL